MKFAQLNGLQISEDQVKDLQKQIDGQRCTPLAIGVPAEESFYNTGEAEFTTEWAAVAAADRDGTFKLINKTIRNREQYTWMSKKSCQDLILFLKKCITDIDNGVLE